jgi:hypothetical protein
MEDDERSSSILDEETGKPRLLADKCETCIFRPGNLMRLRPGRVGGMVQDAVNGGGYITCHATLDGPQNPTRVRAAICRGFYDGYARSSNVLRVFGRLGGFTEIPPPPKGDV